MDNIEKKVEESVNSGFVKHVFNFDNETKNSLMNVIQYIIIAFIPCMMANNFIDSVVPKVDEKKSNLEIIIEVLGQTIITFVFIMLVHRLITYIPTYSGRAYDDVNLINLILISMVMSYESSTTIGKKSKILLNRLHELWEGKENNNNNNNKQNNNKVKVSQPISGLTSPVPTHQPSRSDYLGMHNQMKPPQQEQQNNVATSNGNDSNTYENAGFGGLVGATQPMQDPMAANSMGGSFSSW
jgi:hypothetical protein